MKTWLLSICLIFVSFLAQGESNTDRFKTANKAFEEKRFEEAASQYEAILKEGKQSANLYYNLGNAYFKSSKFGNAVLAYEKGLLIQPRHAALRKNLATVQSSLPNEIDPLPGFFVFEGWKKLRSLANGNVWSIAFLVFLWLGIASIVAWMIGKKRKTRKQGFFLALLLLGLSIPCFFLALQSHHRKQVGKDVIVLVNEAPLRKGPDNISEIVLPLPEGAKLAIKDKLKTENQWYKVRLLNGETGWVLAKDVGLVAL